MTKMISKNQINNQQRICKVVLDNLINTAYCKNNIVTQHWILNRTIPIIYWVKLLNKTKLFFLIYM